MPTSTRNASKRVVPWDMGHGLPGEPLTRRTLLGLMVAGFAIMALVIVGIRVGRTDADGTYHRTVTTTSPCAMSWREVRANHGAEDDLCAAWIGPRGRVHVGPLSDAPARANIVGG